METASSTRPSLYLMLCARLVGVDRTRLAQCLPDDALRVRIVGSAMLVGFLFLWIGFFSGLASVVGLTTTFEVTLSAGLALVCALTVMQLDRSIVFSHWYQMGARQAEELGLQMSAPHWIEGLLLGSFRILLSLVVSWTLVHFMTLAFWSEVISARIADDNLALNRPVIAAAETAVSAELAQIEADIEATFNDITNIRQAEADRLTELRDQRLADRDVLTRRRDDLMTEIASLEEQRLCALKDPFLAPDLLNG